MNFKKMKNKKFVGILTGLIILLGASAYSIQNNIIPDIIGSTDVDKKQEVKTDSEKDAEDKLVELKKKDEEILAKVKKKEEERKDKTYPKELAKQYGKTEDEIKKMKEEAGNWRDVSKKLLVEDNSKSLSEEKVEELYDKGHSLSDITKAEEIASMCEKTPEEILAIKGTTNDYNEKLANNGKKTGNSNVDNSKSWEEVENALKVDTRSPAEQAGVSKDQIAQLEKDGMSNDDINKAAILSKNHKKKFDNVVDEMKKGKKYEDLDKQYTQEKLDTPEQKALTEKHLEEGVEIMIKKNFGVSDEIISKCHEHGIRGIDIVNVKKLVDKYKVSIDKVLELYDQKKDLKIVIKEFGGLK